MKFLPALILTFSVCVTAPAGTARRASCSVLVNDAGFVLNGDAIFACPER